MKKLAKTNGNTLGKSEKSFFSMTVLLRQRGYKSPAIKEKGTL